ncbi:MAG: FtsX-like permease family protein [Luteitalea sp.]|nr:FtsX-like permease family protein [Luteitalea sp.]
MSWLSRLINVVRASKVERDLDDELRFHIDARIDALVQTGLPRHVAEEQVVRQFGSRLRLREASRDVKLLPWLDSLVRDIRLGLRMLRKHAVVTGAAIVSLSLALGACTGAFSLIDALILRPLPVRAPERLIHLTFPTYDPAWPENDTFSDPLFVRLREAARGRVDLFAVSYPERPSATFGDQGGEKEKLRTQFVSGDTFNRLGVVPAVGRLLTPQDDVRPGAHPVAVVSHAFWMRRFGGDPAIVGRWFALEERRAFGSGLWAGGQFQIVGVAEPRFMGVEPGRATDLWLPYAMAPGRLGNPEHSSFRVIGRVKEDASLEQVQSVLQAAFTSFRREHVERFGRGQSPESLERFVGTPLYVRSAANGPSPLRQQFERSLWILAAIAALVLLIAGSNVANLFLARTAAREREMSLRVSIGAGRGRLIQQMLVESALVAGVACALGLLFAGVAAPAVVGMLASADDPVYLDLRVDWRLVAFVGSLALLTTAVFGLAPALRAASVAPMTALKTGSAGAGTRAGVMRPFVAFQVAFSLVVLFVGGLLVLSFARLASVNPGFSSSGVVLLSVEPLHRVDEKRLHRALLQILDRLRDVPGVQAVSSAEFNVLGRPWRHYVRVPGTEHETIEATMAPVTPGFFETMRIPVLDGRTFTRRDIEAKNSTAVVVNQTFARRYFGRERAVGRLFEGRFDDNVVQNEIVGVVADTKHDLREPAAPTLYIPLRATGTFHVRTADDSATLMSRLREEVHAADPAFRVTAVTPQSAVIDQTLLRERLLALLSGFFAVVGLVLAAVGLYGVLSYSVVQRTKEIGIRLALGAQQLAVVRSVVTDAGITMLVGAAGGLAGGLYLARFVRALLYEVQPFDLWSLALPVGSLLCAGALAAVLPARRAARVDPVVALRYE